MKGNGTPKYPAGLFWIGFLLNMTKNFFLLFPAILLLILGIFFEKCLLIGLALLILDIAVSFIQQIQIRNATLNSDNPNFREWQDAILSPEWKENITDLLGSKMEQNGEVGSDEEDSDDPSA